jgi:hypothetical protein
MGRRRQYRNPETADTVAVELTGPLKVAGEWKKRGDVVIMTTTNAKDLVYTNRGRYARSDMTPTAEPGANPETSGQYRRRDMQSE